MGRRELIHIDYALESVELCGLNTQNLDDGFVKFNYINNSEIPTQTI